MNDVEYPLARVEGSAGLLQSETGLLRLAGRQPRFFEAYMQGRAAAEAVYLTQRISGASSVTHGLAALMAWEDAMGTHVAHNGLLLRDLLHGLSLLHAHLRHLYLDVLPDYLPMSALAKYKGADPVLIRQGAAVGARGKDSWESHGFSHPFSAKQADQLLDGRQRALQVMAVLQKMMARIGGKFPIVMSLVAGGVSVKVDEVLALRLRDYLTDITPYLETRPAEDMDLLVKANPNLKTLGAGGREFLGVGSVGDVSGPDAAFFPRGLALDDRLEAFQSLVAESVETAFYKIPLRRKSSLEVLRPAPDKAGAYSWIKAPRYKGLPLETGPLARLVVTYLAGSRRHAAPVVDQLATALGLPMADFNTVGGRLLACAGEIAPLARRCMESLSSLQPGQPGVTTEEPARDGGDGLSYIEGPAGAVSHRLVLRKGRVAHYDIVSASTWNGASQDEQGRSGAIEKVLNNAGLDLRRAEDRLTASRILHSYYYSTSDAVH